MCLQQMKIQCKDLRLTDIMAADFSGTSDPFCRFYTHPEGLLQVAGAKTSVKVRVQPGATAMRTGEAAAVDVQRLSKQVSRSRSSVSRLLGGSGRHLPESSAAESSAAESSTTRSETRNETRNETRKSQNASKRHVTKWKDTQVGGVGINTAHPPAACRLPLAACHLPLATCRLPLAACHLPLVG